MRLMRYTNVLALAVVMVGFGATAHAADQGSTQTLHKITGNVLFMTPDEMQVGTTQGIVDLKITKQTEPNPNVSQNDYVDVWYEAVPNVGNVVVRYAKSSQPMHEQSGAMQSGQKATGSSSSSSNAMGSTSGSSTMQQSQSQSSTSPQPAAAQPTQGTSSQSSQSGSQGMKELPHTASSWPLVGLVGALALVGAVVLTVPRLRG